TTRIESFQRYRLNMPVEDSGQWLAWGQFEALADPRPIPDGARVALGFDGSVSYDGTALVAVTVDDRPHAQLVGLWERPDGAEDWAVPRAEVEGLLEASMARWDVVEVACDPHWWRDSIQAWSQRWPGKILEWPTHVPARMCPATDRAYAAIAEGRMSHDGND